jgi:hypothetical protein
MRLIKQRKNECYLCTLAMLSDRSVDEILAHASVLSPYQHSWGMFTSTGNQGDIDLTYRALARKYVPWLMGVGSGLNVKEMLTKPNFFMLSDDYIAETGEGIGVALLACPNPVGAHIVAWQDGLIYDSSIDQPLDSFEHFVAVASHGMVPFKVIRKPE